MEYFVIGFVGTAIWLTYEYWRAPMIDEITGRTIKPAKTFKDLFKRK